MRRLAAVLALALAAAACSKSPSGGGEAGTPPGVAPAPAGPVAAHISSVTALRRQPSDAPRVPGPRKDVPNQLAILQRGERITVVETRDDWVKVRSSDDQEGWVRRAAVLEGDGVEEATVLAPADVFDRPDLLAANARRKIEPGTLLLVVKTRAPFAEVNVSSGPNAWVLAERLATGEKEVSVAKLAEKARWLARNGKSEEAKKILALARQHFSGISLVDTLAAELGEAGAGGELVPTSAPASDR